jgi:hypothetical protein
MLKDAAPARRRITAMTTAISTSEKPLFERLARKSGEPKHSCSIEVRPLTERDWSEILMVKIRQVYLTTEVMMD